MAIKTNTDRLLLYVLIIFFVVTTFVWFQRDKVPPMWDQSEYLERSEVLYSTLTKKGVIPFLVSFPDVFRTKAPLLAALPVPCYMVMGDTYKSARCVNVFFIIIGSYYLFKLGTILSNERAGLLSVFVLNTFPLAFGLSREFLVEFGLMVFVVMWMYYVLKSDIFENRKHAYALGILLGLGSLMKITYLLYILPPTLYLYVRKTRNSGRINRASLKNILITAVMGIVISGIWYFKNLSSIVSYVLSAGYGKIAQNYGMGDIFSWRTILDYWLFLINYGLSSYYFVLIIFLIITGFVLYFKNKHIPFADKSYLYALLIWFSIPFIIFTFGVNKDYRFTAPLFPAIALLMGTLLENSTRRNGKVILFAILIFPLVNYSYVSFSSGPVSLRLKQFIIFENCLGYAHPPVRERWPVKKVIEFITKDAMRTNNTYAVATLLFNHQYFNTITLSYYSKSGNSMMIFNDLPEGKTLDEIVSKIEQESDYLFSKSDKLGPEFTTAKNIPIITLLNRGELKFRQIAVIRLPDKTYLTIYKRTVADFVYPNREIFKKDHRINTMNSVNFSDKVNLLGSQIIRSKDGYKLILFWECLNDIDLNYKIFVHVSDMHNKPVLNLDHYPVNNKYPVPEWRKGEIIRDEVNINAVLPEVFHINVGIYEETLGERLLLKDKPKDDPDNISGIRIL